MKKIVLFIIYFFLTLQVLSGCNKKDPDVHVTEDTEATKIPFALDDKVKCFYHPENKSENMQKEYGSVKEVLTEYGIEEVIDIPLYQYYDADGEVCLSLYYDEEQNIGVVWFDPSVSTVDDAICYVFYGSEIEEYSGPEEIWPYETDSNAGDYLEPVLDDVEVVSYHKNSASPTYVYITEKGDEDKFVARIDYLYYTDVECDLKCVKFCGEKAVFGETANKFEIWYKDNEQILHDGILIGDIKYQTYNINDKTKYEFYGEVGEKNISIIIMDDVAVVTGLK